MSIVDSIRNELDPKEIMRAVGRKHDDARIQYRMTTNTVESIEDFTRKIGDYFMHHYAHCFDGSSLPMYECEQRAKEIITNAYTRRDGNFLSAFNDAKDGLNGGMRRILDLIADGLKEDGIRRYTEHILDTRISPASYDEQLQIIRELLPRLGLTEQASHPERYVSDYKKLIQAYLKRLRETETLFQQFPA